MNEKSSPASLVVTTLTILGRPPKGRGFTLLEMLVVLVLISVIAGLTLPRLSRLYDSTLYSFDRAQVMGRIEGLGLQALQQGSGISLGGGADSDGKLPLLPVALPEGWHMSANPGIRFLANGVCLGGEVEVWTDHRKERWRLSPPLCRPEVL